MLHEFCFTLRKDTIWLLFIFSKDRLFITCNLWGYTPLLLSVVYASTVVYASSSVLTPSLLSYFDADLQACQHKLGELNYNTKCSAKFSFKCHSYRRQTKHEETRQKEYCCTMLV
ncbi:hypothetical protein AAHE18_15G158300 [Arachis hypogaea]